jgi:TonB family protein
MAKPKPSAASASSGPSVAPLSAETLRRYAAGELSPTEQHTVEEQLLNSQLHADAAEGFEAAGATTAQAAQADLLGRLQQRVNEPPAEPIAAETASVPTSAPLLAMSAQRKRRWMIIGGVLIGFAALGGGLLMRYDRYVDEEALAAKTRRAANYKGEDSEPKGFFASLFSDDEPSPEEIAAKRQADSLQVVAKAAEVERLRALEEQRRQERDDARRERDAAAVAAAAAAPVVAPRPERPAEPTMRRMRGQVTTDAGVAIANAVVTIRATGRKVAAGADGWFNLELPSGSDPTLDVEAPGFVTRTARANGDGQVNVRLSTAEAVAVQSMASAVAAEKRIRTVRPEPEGGYGGYYRYLASAASLPDEAKRQKINGQVQVEFQVNPNGSLSDFRVVQGLGFGCDEEAVRVIQDGPKWTPGKANGEPVIKKVSMPVPFGK